MGWINLDEFKQITGIKIDDDTIQQALDVSQQEIIRKLFRTFIYSYGSATSTHELFYPIADWSADGVIGTSDIDIWEEDTNKNEFERQSNVVLVQNTRRRSLVTLNTALPISGRTLYIKYKQSSQDIPKMLPHLKELQKLITVDYLFTNVPFSKLQRGINNWSLNGVSVQFDQSAMIQAKEENKKAENRLMNMLKIFRVDGVAPGTLFHQRVDRSRQGVVTGGYGYSRGYGYNAYNNSYWR